MKKILNLFTFWRSKINFISIRREFFVWIILGFFLYFVSKKFDYIIFDWIENWRTDFLDNFSIILTEKIIYIILIIFVLTTFLRIWKNKRHKSKLLPGFFAIITAGILGIIAKEWFDIPRPFLQIENLEPIINPFSNVITFAQARTASFPSLHTALAFSILLPICRISKMLGIFWLIFAILISFARVYQNVHFPSDIAVGIFLGGIIGSIFSNPNTELLLEKWWKILEFRRQSLHFLSGFFCVFLHWIGFLRWRFILIILIFGLIISWISVKRKIPIISDFLGLFDRLNDKKFPGRGAFYFLLGIFLTIIIFPVKIAYASILILAVGDSFNHLITNKKFLKDTHIKLPWNKNKNIFGIALGVLFGTFAAQFFVPIIPAFIATSCSLLLETCILKIGKFYLDDNLFIPILSGTIIYLLV